MEYSDWISCGFYLNFMRSLQLPVHAALLMGPIIRHHMPHVNWVQAMTAAYIKKGGHNHGHGCVYGTSRQGHVNCKGEYKFKAIMNKISVGTSLDLQLHLNRSSPTSARHVRQHIDPHDWRTSWLCVRHRLHACELCRGIRYAVAVRGRWNDEYAHLPSIIIRLDKTTLEEAATPPICPTFWFRCDKTTPVSTTVPVFPLSCEMA